MTALRPRCPDCFRGLLDEGTYEPRLCAYHAPSLAAGLDDALVADDAYTPTILEGGTDGRAWAELLHRKVLLTRGAT